MDKLTLYHIEPSRSSTVLWLLEELEIPFELKTLDYKKQENQTPEYLAINPMGKVPAIVEGDIVTTEAGAICCYLADKYASANLNIDIGHPLRGPYLKWLFFGPSCLEPAILDVLYERQTSAPPGSLGWGSLDAVMKVIRQALSQGNYLVGDKFTAADIVIGSGLRFGLVTKVVPEHTDITSYLTRLEERPGWQRLLAHKHDKAD